MKQQFSIHKINSTISNRHSWSFPLLIALLCLFVVLVSSCEETDESLTGGSRMPAVFTPLIEGEVAEGISTRATGTTWDTNDQVGIYMTTAGSLVGTTNLATNIAYKTSVVGSNTSLVPVNASETIYYPADGSKVNFTAYYPYKSGVTTDYTVDITTQNPQSAIDVLWHKGSVGYSQYNAAASLKFGHMMSKVIINVNRGSSLGTTNISGLTSTITGTPTKAILKIANAGLSSVGTIATITPVKSTSTADKVVFEAILIPHGTVANRTMTFTFSGTTYTYPITQAFEYGKKYTYNLILTNSGVALQEVTIGDWGTGTANWDGKYALTTSTNALNFGAFAPPSQTVTVRTKGTTNVPTVTYPSWLTYTGPTKTTSGEWTLYTYTFHCGSNINSILHTGSVVFSVEGLSATIPFRQPSTHANSYILGPGGNSITFPITRSGISAGTSFTAQILWQDALCVATVTPNVSAGTITITSGAAGVVGNCVITAKVGSEIKWSWHIWVTEYEPDPTKTFMDRNLGAINCTPGSLGALGLYYQWGRKDPFPGANTISGVGTERTLYNSAGTTFAYTMSTIALTGLGYPTRIAGQQSMGWAIQNPATFIGFNGSWFPNPTTTDNPWGEAASKHTYDPCPAGWRVPSRTSWTSLIANFSWSSINKGNTLSSCGGWYSASGHRDGANGGLYTIGSRGYYWAATPSSSDVNKAYMLYFVTTDTPPSNGYHNERAIACSVRCVVE